MKNKVLDSENNVLDWVRLNGQICLLRNHEEGERPSIAYVSSVLILVTYERSCAAGAVIIVLEILKLTKCREPQKRIILYEVWFRIRSF